MILFDLGKCAKLHISRYSRLLICSLFFYSVHTSCSTQAKHNVTYSQSSQKLKSGKINNAFKQVKTYVGNVMADLLQGNKKKNSLTEIQNKESLTLTIKRGDIETVKNLLPYTELYSKDTNDPIFLRFALDAYCTPNLDPTVSRNINQIIYLLYDRYNGALHVKNNDEIKRKSLQKIRVEMTSVFLKKPIYLCLLLDEYCNLALDPAANEKMEATIQRFLDSDKDYCNTTNKIKNTKNIDYLVKTIVALATKYRLSEPKKEFLAKVANVILAKQKADKLV